MGMMGRCGTRGDVGDIGMAGPGLQDDDACDTLTVRRELVVNGLPIGGLIRYVYRHMIHDLLVTRRHYCPAPIADWLMRYIGV
jgi:hypothetical protein